MPACAGQEKAIGCLAGAWGATALAGCKVQAQRGRVYCWWSIKRAARLVPTRWRPPNHQAGGGRRSIPN
eukprot:scaffold255534_cov14-Tisochrysis_lutea.AAC.1